MGIVRRVSLMGTMPPPLLKRRGFAPATPSARLVATLVEATGLIVYFSAAHRIIRGTLW